MSRWSDVFWAGFLANELFGNNNSNKGSGGSDLGDGIITFLGIYFVCGIALGIISYILSFAVKLLGLPIVVTLISIAYLFMYFAQRWEKGLIKTMIWYLPLTYLAIALFLSFAYIPDWLVEKPDKEQFILVFYYDIALVVIMEVLYQIRNAILRCVNPPKGMENNVNNPQ